MAMDIHELDGLPRLLEIMRQLRDPDTGCPWDIVQTPTTIAPYSIEEAHEVADAIDREAWDELEDELGDLLFQVVFQAQMAAEAGRFTFDSIATRAGQKMIDRHPHIFGDESRDKSAEQQTRDWEAIKAKERASKAQKGALDGVAKGLPALMRALKLQKRAARVGFDWTEVEDVLAKLDEETRELVEARDQKTATEVEEEFGDLLFVMVNIGRHLGVDAEIALRGTNAKFTRRFEGIEAELARQGKTPETATLEEMDAIWNDFRAQDKVKP
ncbi:MAG: nucleoside triphosphate pyrophosphohydrolase [Pseudomonadota bacterium]